MKKLLTVFVAVLSSVVLYGQGVSDTLTVFFRKESALVDGSYMSNAERSKAFFARVDAMRDIANSYVISVELLSSSSPEGQYSFNDMLSQRRKDTVTRLIRKNLDVDEIEFITNSLGEDWGFVAEYVKADPKLTERVKTRILDIIHQYDGKENYDDEINDQIHKIDNSITYWYLYHKIFPKLRACRVTITYDLSGLLDDIVLEDEDIVVPEDVFADLEPDTLTVQPMPMPMSSQKKLILKANGLGYAIGQFNVAAEYAFAEHMSVALPFYYSGGFDYFKSTIKFRGIVVQPEFRYWFSPENEGLYLGAHLGVGWYNFALNGDYRIQDHKGTRPAWGGGVGAGYTLQFKKYPRWGMEFALGVGVYDVKYDMFYNEPNGPYAEVGVHDTFVGIDNASVAVTYKFFHKRKEGKL